MELAANPFFREGARTALPPHNAKSVCGSKNRGPANTACLTPAAQARRSPAPACPAAPQDALFRWGGDRKDPWCREGAAADWKERLARRLGTSVAARGGASMLVLEH
jgi:hypothetical protein